MLDIFSGLRLVVKRRNINIDNAIFRCHWFFTSTLLVSFSLIITARQYVGQPIECHSTDKIPDSLLNSYCWVQSTFTVPQACSGQQYGVDVPYPCIDNTRGREIKIYAYYQWVGIVLFIQGLLFHLPYYLWKLWENGLIKAITGGLRVAVLNEQERLKKKDIVVEYIHDHLGCHRRYAFKYFLCEFICLINLFGQLWATNKFFDGQFLRYGIEVMQYSATLSMSPTASLQSSSQQLSSYSSTSNNYSASTMINDNDSINGQQSSGHQARASIMTKFKQQVDPMTFVFPRMTKCTYYDFGSSGDVQKHDALCLLPLNIINEKIYIALWFWFLILAILTTLVIIYRLFAIASESVRCKGLISRCKLSCERDIRLICRQCDVGDWFLFYMVAENLDPLIMREIISSIASKINEQLELKRELKAQFEKEEEQQQRSERDKLLRRETDDEKLTPIFANDSHLLAAEGARHCQLAPPPPLGPSAPIRRDSFDSEYLANIFGWQQSSSSRRSSLVDQIPYVKNITRRLSIRRLWSTDSSLGKQRQQLLSEAPLSNVMGSRQTGPSGSMPSTSRQQANEQQVVHFEHASAPPVSAMHLQSAPPLAQRHHFRTPVLTHRRAPRLQRRGSLNLLNSQSSCDSGVSSLSARTANESSCVMEMGSFGSSSRLEKLGQVLRRQ